jgi:hypothetical protein
MTFQGSLKELHLPDVIQLVSVSGKSGVFVLSYDGEDGLIYLENGRIVHAVLADIQGEEAVYTLATWGDGSFRFYPNEEAPAHTITKSNTNLLMEAARRLDEWRVLSKRIPSLDSVPVFKVPEGKQGQINLNTQEWRILSKIDGEKSITDIAKEIQSSTFEVAKLLYGLVTMGLITLEEKPKQAASSEPAPAMGEETEVGLMRLLAVLKDEARVIMGDPITPHADDAHDKAKAELQAGKGTEAIQTMCREILGKANEIGGPDSQRQLAERFRDVLESWNSASP